MPSDRNANIRSLNHWKRIINASPNLGGFRQPALCLLILLAAVFAFTTTSPAGSYVISHTPSGVVNRPVGYVEVTFSEQINGASFTTDDVIFTAPGSTPVAVDPPVDGGNNVWRIDFAEQSADGDYQLAIGPHIENLAGVELDESYTGSFTIDLTPPPEITTLAVNTLGNGTLADLDWSGYDEAAAGDVADYRIYVETSDFRVVPATEFDTVDAGQFTYTATGLNKGETYFFAVVAVDHAGNAITEMSTSPASGIPTDVEPPELVTNLQVTCTETALTFTWDHSSNSAGDLANYMVYFDGDPTGVLVGSTQNSYEVTGLNPASGYGFAVVAIDMDGNESMPASTTGVTLLDNPANLTAASSYGRVDLNWSGVSSPELVKNYAVYMSQSPFTSVEGMTPTATAYGNFASVGGLPNNVTYYFAVTAVNLSDGERKDVTTVSADSLPVTYVSGTISSNTTWTLDKSPYIVTGNITVRKSSNSPNSSPSAAVLTIEPGVIVRFEPGTGLYIGLNHSHSSYSYFGALSAQGTAAQPIIFTSNAAVPAPGDWQGIYFRDETHDGATLLDHCVIEYGGHTNNSNLYFAAANPTIRNSTIRNSSSHGLYLNASAPIIDGNIITSNNSYGVSCNSSSAGYIKNNVITINGNAPINIHPNSVRIKRVSGNSGSGNGKEYIRIYGGTIFSDSTWAKQGFPYGIDGDVTVRKGNYAYNSSPSAATLTIEPGVEVRFSPGTGLYIGLNHSNSTISYFGALSAQGTEADPILFTSNATEPAPGDWKGIYFRDETYDVGTILNNCIIEYGGHTNNSIIYFASGAHPTIQNSNIRHSSLNGIYGADNSSAAITNNIFYSNLGPAINVHPNRAYNLNGNSDPIDGKSYIRIRGGEVTSSTTWKKQELPFVIAGDVTVRIESYAYNSNPSAATLTIEPGVEVRFSPGTGLYIGRYHSNPTISYFGALSAQGTESDPIIFTSNASEPAPGDWKGIYFRDETYDALSILAHCIVKYGGHTNSSNIHCASSSPKIRKSRIQRSSAHGIYLSGSSNPTIGGEDNGNIITENESHGIYSASTSPYPSITYNTITNNGSYPIRVRPRMNNVSNNSCYGNNIDKIAILGEEITANTTWKKNNVPYVVLGDVTVRKGNYAYNTSPSAATLTIEPGVEVRFSPGTGLYIGRNHSNSSISYFGALSAQGTESDPIIFTSNAAEPAPGDWKGIYFRNETYDISSLIEHCIAEYGGNSHNANIYLANAKPTIQYNTIRNSSHSGVYVNGTGANGAIISCNNLKDNLYGIYVIGDAQPLVNNNNFLRSQQYGAYNAGSAILDATSNWWGDANGPGYNGDEVYGNIEFTPWLTAASDCINTPPTNSPPFTPKNPSPSNAAVRVPVISEGIPVDVALSWAGGDPNPWDTVVYDIYLGSNPDNLPLVAGNHSTSDYAAAGLGEGTTYYWKIVSRDNGIGELETAGPLWHFTTLGDPPDLVVSIASWEPATGIQAGQTVTFTATVANSGSGPVVDTFQVGFEIGANSIGSKTVSPVIAQGGTVQVSQTWTAATGDHSITVTADSGAAVLETFEENNSFTAALPHVSDPTPPEVASTQPVDGAAVQSVTAIVFTLYDQYGVVDDAAVIASVDVRDSGSDAVAGSVAESNDTFTFIPSVAPDSLPNGAYTVSFTAADAEGNTQAHSFSFTVDDLPPAAPAVTGGTVFSGLIQPRPAENRSNSTTVTLTGTREANTGVWINNLQKATASSGDWTVDLTLAQGDNALEIWLEDAAANRGPSIWADIQVDSAAPAISAVSPADNSFINTPPATVVITFQETASGLNLENSSLSVKDGGQAVVDGTWSVSGTDQLVFTPAAALVESYYTVAVQLEDNFTNRGPAGQYHFTLDLTSPAAPVVNAVTSPTHNPSQVVSGTKEAYEAIWLDGQQVVDHTAETTWQHAANLISGPNTLTYIARDRAGNQGPETTVEIVFDDIPPPPVDSLTINNQGDGLTVYLDWTGYDEAAHGDVNSYRIYIETAAFSDVSGLASKFPVSSGNFSYTAGNLTRGTTYWFAVIAVDVMGNASTTAAPISKVPADIVPPEEVTNLKAQSFADRLVFTWDHSADSYSDLAGYHVYFADEIEPVVLEPTLNSHERTGLSAANGYLFRVVAFDHDNNESSGKAATGVTWLPNPVNLAAAPYSGYVDLTWNAALPAEYVKHYAVYVSESDFTTVDGMTPTLTTTTASAKVAGLTNNLTYYFAVTTINTSDGQDPAVSAITAVPEADTTGPEITDVQVDGTALLGGHTLTKPVAFTCNAADPAGVSRVEYIIDGSLIRTDYSPGYSAYWNIVPETDGVHTLTITAYDTLANSTTLDFALNVALAPPAAPIVTEPINGRVTNQPQITVSGLAEKDTELMVYNSSVEAGSWLSVDAAGGFSTSLILVEGENRLQAAARNRAGAGPMTAEVVVTLDTTLPQSPVGLSATSKAAGEIRPAAAGHFGFRIQPVPQRQCHQRPRICRQGERESDHRHRV